jgi:hypothetical protein
MDITEKIQTLIFDNQQQIPEGVYVEIMDLLKEHHNKEHDFYRLHYFIIKPLVHPKEDNEDNEINICVTKQNNLTCIVEYKALNEILQSQIKNFDGNPFKTCAGYINLKSVTYYQECIEDLELNFELNHYAIIYKIDKL